MNETDCEFTATPDHSQSKNATSNRDGLLSRRGLIAGLAAASLVAPSQSAAAYVPVTPITPIAALRREFDRQARQWEIGGGSMDVLARAAALMPLDDEGDRVHLRHMAAWEEALNGGIHRLMEGLRESLISKAAS